MKRHLKIITNDNNMHKFINYKNNSFSFLINDNKVETDKDPIMQFIQKYITETTNNNINTNCNLTESKEMAIDKKIITPRIIKAKNNRFILNEIENYKMNNSLNNNKGSNTDIKNFNKPKKEKYQLSIVELKDLTNSKNEKKLLTENIKNKKRINIHLSEEKKKCFFRNNKIIYNFYMDFMRRKKQKELIESKLFKQKLISQFIRYSSSYMRKCEAKIEENIQKDRQYLEQKRAENNLKKYNEFKNKITRRLIEGNIDYENENTNLFINSIYRYLYKNIMNYDNLICYLSKFKGKLSNNMAKMISEFLSLKFDCFKNIKKTYGGAQKLIKLCELLKLEKYKKNEIIYDIDNYENKYFLLLKGKIDVYQRYYIKQKMKIGEFINYLKDIKEKENNIFKFYRIIHKNMFEKTFDKFDCLEENLNDILNLKEHFNILDTNDFYIEELRIIGNKIQGENINNIYNNEKMINFDIDYNYGKDILFKNNPPDNINNFFSKKENRIYYKENYSDKRYICTEECLLVSIEKEAFKRKLFELETKLFGQSGEQFILYTFIFKNWKKEIINSIIKNFCHKKYLTQGEYLYKQNDKSEKIYIIIRGVFAQYISLNTKRINEIKKYIAFNKKNIFLSWKNKKKILINKEEIDTFFEFEEAKNGDFPFEIMNKVNKIDKEDKEDKKQKMTQKINIFNSKYYIKKREEENEKNDIQNLKLKNCYKFEVLGMEEAIEGKHRFTSVKCQSKKGEILEMKINDFIYFCFHRNININYLEEIIINLKNILIQKIGNILQVNHNSLKNTTNYDNEVKEDNNINDSKNDKLTINKKVYKKNYFEDKIFDPLENSLNNLNKYKKNKLKEKYDILRFTPNHTYRNNNNTYKDLFFGYFMGESINNDKIIKEKNLVSSIKNNDIGEANNNITKNNIEEINSNKEVNNNIENTNFFEKNMNIINNINNNINHYNNKSEHNLKKKIFFENLQINKYNHSIKKTKNKKINEREEIRKKYLLAKKKLEERGPLTQAR